MKFIADEEKIQQTIHKNTATSYGLTLVIGLPFPAEIGSRIQHIQDQLEALAPDRFTWYSLDQLHATLIAPLRGRYRQWPPLQREELPADLQGFVHDLAGFFAQCQPLSLELAGVSVRSEGLFMVNAIANFTRQRLASDLQKYPELDAPKDLKGLHVTIGFLNTPRPFNTEAERLRFDSAMASLTDAPIGRMTVERVWLVHYADRTLHHVLGRVLFYLGRSNAVTAEALLRDLGVANSSLANVPSSSSESPKNPSGAERPR